LAGILISTGILIPIGTPAAQAAPLQWRGPALEKNSLCACRAGFRIRSL
jgi:hypothetical protein